VANKELFCEVNIKLQPLKSDENIDAKLEYYLIEEVYKNDEETGEEFNTFGVEVVKKEYLQNNIINIETNSANHLLFERLKAKQLLDDLSKNIVTPIGLYDVLDNLIGISY